MFSLLIPTSSWDYSGSTVCWVVFRMLIRLHLCYANIYLLLLIKCYLMESTFLLFCETYHWNLNKELIMYTVVVIYWKNLSNVDSRLWLVFYRSHCFIAVPLCQPPSLISICSHQAGVINSRQTSSGSLSRAARHAN